jgi:mannose-1-phosphate guanylyltransferase
MKSFCVIMAGGRGERLWPVSTAQRPKQFTSLGSKQTMLQETVRRISPFVAQEDIYVVCPAQYAESVIEQLDIPPQNVIMEPIGRNTAPCVGLAAIVLERKDPSATMILLPADHVIKNGDQFLNILKLATQVASSERQLVTLGIMPDRPATGYGYIQLGKLVDEADDIGVYEVDRFTEKPDEKTAKRFLEEGNYYWNSGMFVWRIDVILDEIMQHMPGLHADLMEIKRHMGKPDLEQIIAGVYRKQESISIDYGVMEKSSQVLAIPADIGWSDVGDWSALDSVFDRDGNGNVVKANHVGIDTKNCVIYQQETDRRIATVGLENLVIIDTQDTLLVMPKQKSQKVRDILKKIQDQR